MARVERSKGVKPPIFIELADLKDLVRLACALEKAPLPVFLFERRGFKAASVQLDLFKGSPIFYYAVVDKSYHFLGYRNLSGSEDIVMTDSVSNPSYAYAPVIWVQKLPEIFEKGWREAGSKADRFLTIQVSDLSSLAKVASYKMLFEEPPLPLFLFQAGDRWILGAFTRIDEYEDISLFFCLKLDAQPERSFVRYSPTKTQDTGFTNRTDEHGFVYMKIVKLKVAHPLAEVP